MEKDQKGSFKEQQPSWSRPRTHNSVIVGSSPTWCTMSPWSRGLGLHPFTVATRVRIPLEIRLLNSGVESPPCKRVVVGSNPTGGSEDWQSGRMQRFAKSQIERSTGSNPVSSARPLQFSGQNDGLLSHASQVRFLPGVLYFLGCFG